VRDCEQAMFSRLSVGGLGTMENDFKDFKNPSGFWTDVNVDVLIFRGEEICNLL